MDRRTGDLFSDGGIPGRDEGMARSVEHADTVFGSWSGDALGMLVRFAALGRPFITPELREYAIAMGLPEPPTNWAWGSVVNRAVRGGLIKQCGTRSSGNGRDHKKVRPVWVRL